MSPAAVPTATTRSTHCSSHSIGATRSNSRCRDDGDDRAHGRPAGRSGGAGSCAAGRKGPAGAKPVVRLGSTSGSPSGYLWAPGSAEAVRTRRRCCSGSIAFGVSTSPARTSPGSPLTLGADVPFFVVGEPAIARGIGEQLTPVTLPMTWVAVIAPPVNVPTAMIFAAPELTRDSASAKMDVFSEGYGRNDLEPAAVARFPDIDAALGMLRRYSGSARMTGSGGCVFAPFVREADARAALKATPPGTQGFVARTLARHPLADFA